MTYGFVGVGAIATAMTAGLSEGAPEPPPILLSPRNAQRAARLASLYRNVRVAPDNQAVVDGAETVILSVRPQDAPAVLRSLRFRQEQSIVSVMAGLSIEALKPLVAPATDISRAIPLPTVARRACPTPILPPGGAASALFDPLGGTIELIDAEAFDAFSVATGTMAAFFVYLDEISGWLAGRGVPPDQAQSYVSAVFAGLAPALERGERLDHLAREHATRGGVNERFLRHLKQWGFSEAVRRGLDDVSRRLAGLSGGLEVRPVMAEDAPELAWLLNGLIERGGTTALEDPFTPQTLADTYLTGPDVLSCVVAVEPDSGRLAGFQTLVRTPQLPEGWGDIGTFARVDGDRRGVGGALFTATRRRAGQLGLKTLNATIRADNAGGLAYYSKMGFQDYRTDPAVPLKDGRPVDRIHRRLDLR